MNRKDTANLKTHIKRLALWVRTHIFHGEYELDILYVAKGDTDSRLGEKSAAAMQINSTYLTCALIISMKHFSEEWTDGHDREIMRLIVHEFCHLLTEPLYEFAVDAATNSTKEHLENIRERQTQRIANVIMQNIPPKIYKRAAVK